jgi:hypothetical protein
MATAVRERFEEARQVWPALETVDERLRTARRALVDARHASEDALADATLRIRRRPLAAVGGAVAIGIAFGSVCGFVVGYAFTRRRAAQ